MKRNTLFSVSLVSIVLVLIFSSKIDSFKGNDLPKENFIAQNTDKQEIERELIKKTRCSINFSLFGGDFKTIDNVCKDRTG